MERTRTMEKTLIRHPKLHVEVTTGSEGPRHDPYSYTETWVKTPNGVTILHEGLGTWLKFNGKEFEYRRQEHGDFEAYERHVRTELFPRCTGYTLKQLERINRRIESRCRKCGGRDFHSERGFPGETFQVCSRCNDIVSSSFNRSAVE